MMKELPLIPLFEMFIKESVSGKRRKLDGLKFNPRTVENYRSVLKHLVAFENASGKTLRIRTNLRNNTKQLQTEQRYWKKFHKDLTAFLLYKQNCYDNFCGLIFKTIRCFICYLRRDKFYSIHSCCDNLYVRKENIRILTLLPEQFVYLIMDEEFENKLTGKQKKYKDMFVFGTTAAMRFSDLQRLRLDNVELQAEEHYLVYISQKTKTQVHLKLPQFAVDIYKKHAGHKASSSLLFPQIALANFNKRIRQIARLAGWTNSTGKWRSKNGKVLEQKTADNKVFDFCDQLSSHTMRRTGITVLLMLGMPELVVRKVSGHSAHSKEFYRYVNYAQSYMTEELDKAHAKLISLYKK